MKKYTLTDSEVINFSNNFDNLFNNQLLNHHAWSRVVCLAHFKKIIDLLQLQNQKHVGVISGTSNEPELKFLQSKKVSILSFEENKLYDLDMDWKMKKLKKMNFSLTLCNQVLEHVFNPQQAFKNLCYQTQKGGYLWVSIPTINCIHGEPYFFSSGYHPRFLERLAKENNLEIVSIGQWGSKKYMLNAMIGKWLYSDFLIRGFHRKGDLLFPFEIFNDGRKNDKGKTSPIITDCWGLFKK